MRNMEPTPNPLTIKTTNRLFKEIKRKNLEKKQLISNYDFISWLEQFTLSYRSFTDDSWIYTPEELSEADNINVGKIGLFFEALSDYCYKYYINIACNLKYEVECINIKHNGIGYQLGLVVGQGGFIYVQRKEPEDDAIEFSDILNDIAPKDFDDKKVLIQEFEQIVSKMKKMGIPSSVILEIANK